MTSGRLDPIAYVPVEARPWRLTMGLRPLDPVRWLEVDDRRRDEMAAKARLLASDHDRVVAAVPGSEDAGGVLLAEVVSHLDRHHPGLLRVREDGMLVDAATGTTVDPRGLHPVDAAGRLVQEDLCLMTRTGDDWILAAASVCFPSRWRLADKIGRDLSAIHGPVAGYEDALDHPVRAFFDRLRPERPVWRLNWTLLDTPDLFQPGGEDRGRPRVASADLGEATWFRVERQTLRRLSGRPAVVFTIRTYVTPLAELVARHPEVVAGLRTTLPTVPAGSLAYKGWTGLVGPLCDWLSARERGSVSGSGDRADELGGPGHGPEGHAAQDGALVESEHGVGGDDGQHTEHEQRNHR